MDNGSLGSFLPPIPVPPVALASSSQGSRSSGRSGSGYSRQSLKSLDRLLGDDRDPRKLQKLVHKLYDNLKFEKDRADYADRRASETMSYLRSICEEKLRALREVSRLEEELKLYKIQYEEAQKEIFRAQTVISEVDEKRYKAEKEAADARSAARKMRDEINVIKAQEEGRREGLQEGFRRGREMGYQEGLRMAQTELENMARVGPGPVGSSSTENRAPVHSRATSQAFEPQGSSRRYSRTTSNAPSRPPTAPPETPSSPSLAQGQPRVVSQPVQPIEEVPEEPEIIRPRSFRGPSPSPHLPIGPMPPDNFIPRLEGDNMIRLPPPHEFSRLPQTPEPSTSPTLPPTENEEPRMIRPRVSTTFPAGQNQRRRSSSPTSASTTLSHMEMVANPYYGRTPMSAIQESLSQEGTPAVFDAASLRDQPAFATQSVGLMASVSNEPVYRRPPTASPNSSMSFQPPDIPQSDPRASASSASSPAPSNSVLGPSGTNAGGLTKSQSGSLHGDPNTNGSDISFLPPIPETSHPTNSGPFPGHQEAMTSSMNPPGSMPGDWGYGQEYTSGDSKNPPVIPHPDLYTEMDDEEEAVSSGFNSPASLRTPPVRLGDLPHRVASVRSAGGSAVSRRTDGVGASGQPKAGGSRAGSALSMAGNPSGNGSEGGYRPDWGEVYASLSVPLKYPQPPPSDVQSAVGSTRSKTSSNNGHERTLSTGTNRSRR